MDEKLSAELKELDKKQESRLYTVPDNPKMHVDRKYEDVDKRLAGIEQCLAKIASNGHRG